MIEPDENTNSIFHRIDANLDYITENKNSIIELKCFSHLDTVKPELPEYNRDRYHIDENWFYFRQLFLFPKFSETSLDFNYAYIARLQLSLQSNSKSIKSADVDSAMINPFKYQTLNKKMMKITVYWDIAQVADVLIKTPVESNRPKSLMLPVEGKSNSEVSNDLIKFLSEFITTYTSLDDAKGMQGAKADTVSTLLLDLHTPRLVVYFPSRKTYERSLLTPLKDGSTSQPHSGTTIPRKIDGKSFNTILNSTTWDIFSKLLQPSILVRWESAAETGASCVSTSSPMSPKPVDTSATEIIDQSQLHLVQFCDLQLLQASRQNDCTANKTEIDCPFRWQAVTDNSPSISNIISVNGMYMNDLDEAVVKDVINASGHPIKLLCKSKTSKNQSMNHFETVNLSDLKTAITYEAFLDLYNDRSLKSLRSRVDSLLRAYDECDWPNAVMQEKGSPQATVISIYRFIESELQKLGLLSPLIGDSSEETILEQIRTHIEVMIFTRISAKTIQIAPSILASYAACRHTSYQSLSEAKETLNRSSKTSKSPVPAPKVDANTPAAINNKIAALRSLTLHQLGLSPKSTSSTTGSNAANSTSNKSTELTKAWTVAFRLLADSLRERIPSHALTKLVQFNRFLSRLVKMYISSQVSTQDSSESYDHKCNNCGDVHPGRISSVKLGLLHIDSSVIVESNNSGHRNIVIFDEFSKIRGIRVVDSSNVMCKAMIRFDSRKQQSPEDSEAEAGSMDSGITADELTPALIYSVIQTNFPHIDSILWILSEFRHPELLHGEEAYCLSQLSSSVEFCRSAGPTSLELTWPEYDSMNKKVIESSDFLEMCQRDDVEVASANLTRRVNINCMSIDQRDSPLAMCIRHNSQETFDLLIRNVSSQANGTNLGCRSDSEFELDVSQSISPYHGAIRRISPILLAVQYRRLRMLLLMLRHGGDRYSTDSDGNTPLSLATSTSQFQMQQLIMADPVVCRKSIIPLVLCAQRNILSSLILQNVDMNFAYPFSPTESLYSTPLFSCIEQADVETLKVLLTVSISVHRPIQPSLVFKDSSQPSRVKLVDSGVSAIVKCSMEFESAYDSGHLTAQRSLIIMTAMLLRAEPLSNQSSWSMRKAQWIIAEKIINRLVNRVHPKMYGSADLVAAALNFTQLANENSLLGISRNKDFYLCLHAALWQYKNSDMPSSLLQLTESNNLLGVWTSLVLDAGDCDINETCLERGFTPLIAAVYHQNIPMVELLLQSSKVACIADFSIQSYFSSEIDYSKEVETLEDICPLFSFPSSRVLQLDCADAYGMTALHYAVQSRNNTLVGLLLSTGAKRDIRDSQGRLPVDLLIGTTSDSTSEMLRYDPNEVPITLAAKHNDWRVISALLSQGASINQVYKPTDSKHFSSKDSKASSTISNISKLVTASNIQSTAIHCPLMAAVSHGHIDLLRKLLELRSLTRMDLNITDSQGRTALMHAAIKKDEDAVLALLMAGADRHRMDLQLQTADNLLRAVSLEGTTKQEARKIAKISALLNNDPRTTHVHDVIARGDYDAVIALFKQGASPLQPLNQKDKSKYINTNDYVDGCTPLIAAALYATHNSTNGLKIINLLLKAPEVGVSIDTSDSGQGWTALMHASVVGNEDAVLTLLRAGASRAPVDVRERNALDLARLNGNESIAAILEADPSKVSIHDASFQGKADIVAALIKQGCPLNYRDNRAGKMGFTPLMAACSGGKYSVVRLLLSWPNSGPQLVGLNETDDKGRTSLMLAASRGALDITELLLAAGCNRDAYDDAGLTALGHASRHGTTTYIQLMAQRMIH